MGSWGSGSHRRWALWGVVLGIAGASSIAQAQVVEPGAPAGEQGAVEPAAPAPSDPAATPAGEGEVESATTAAEPATPAPVAATPAPATASTVPAPLTGTFDWVRLVTGEWLPGELDAFRDDELKFDSEEFDDIVLDWEDVSEVHSPNTNRYVRNYDETFAGKATIVGDQVRVETPEGVVTFPRSELTAILPGELREASYWSAHVGLSFSGSWGASRQTSVNGNAWLQREDANTKARLSYDSAWGNSQGVVSVNNMWGRARLDVFVSDLFFVVPISGAVGYDRFLNFELRTTPGAGAGLHLVDEPDVEWDFTAGGAYIFTRYVSVVAGEDVTSHDAGVVLGTTFGWDLTADIELDASHESLVVATDMDLIQFTTEVVFSLDVTDILEVDTTFKHTRVREPVALEDGTVPDQDQYQLLIGVSVDI